MRTILFFKFALLSVSLGIGSGVESYGQQKKEQSCYRAIQAKVVDIQSGKPIPFASVYQDDYQKGSLTDVEGNLLLRVACKQSVALDVGSLGYATKKLVLTKDSSEDILIELELQSIGLPEFVISAKYTDKLGSDAKIDQQALEHINPVSIQDIFVLLPGGRVGANNIHSRSLISSRQAGSDQSTSFGMGVIIDGVPLNNDGYRLQMDGYTGAKGNLQVNSGVDLRTISTDHIQSVTITKGISSAKEGNLSSGAIKIVSKKGKTPLRSRVKFDPLNKLAYIGKGVLLSEKLGTLHAGIDYVESSNDLREVKSAYKRITSQLNYDNQFAFLNRQLDFNLTASYVASLNDRKNDQVVKLKQETYKTTYARYTLSSKLLLHLDSKLLDQIEFNSSLDYTEDVLKHNKKVENVSVQISQSSTQEGESEGIYLPSQYYSFYQIQNKPLNFFSNLGANKTIDITDEFQLKALIGSSLSVTKNRGEGVSVDPERPPFPSNSFIRPRANSDIPALVNHASYLETKLKYKTDFNEVNTSVGVRSTAMLNLPKHYYLSNRFLLEPRLQLSYTNYKQTDKAQWSNSLRIGYGLENKLPSIDYLYPDKIYKDFVAFNGYFTDPAKRLVLVNTKILDPTNSDIKENKNEKIEFGWDFKYNKLSVSLTAFQETMKGGIEYYNQFMPESYTAYNLIDSHITTRPTMEDLDPFLKRDFIVNHTPRNSAKVIKKGIEYRIAMAKIEAIHSEIELNGAYYHTLYTSGVPVMHRPSITHNNRPYPYVGYYKGIDQQNFKTFNTNLWVNTHLPFWKLMISNFVQVTWLERFKLGDDIQVYPSEILDLDGNILPITADQINSDMAYSPLIRDFSTAIYNQEDRPVSLLWNVKVTKEFNKHIKLSFFANNLVQITPSYQTRFLRTQRQRLSPFFGTELTINLF
ncbi:carboxypeptidase-like regulatory domain-containing protein [Myroides odoratimimus]|uniref:carboxypeptidase-like regulatory domain-containing protein n=1 Tax=Myroides odoratimimus TaxID=76832 RepID=UPI001CE12F03|nr:carboxypeptidase-like regulatory domain-containing protein [Myroides odoratimimus]MCA4806970.1 TonB-dependent receptor [Myroides odoratimimus]